MPKITNAEVGLARRALRALLDYEHPKTRNGLRQAVVLQIRAMERELRPHAEAYQESFNALVKRYGTSKDGSGSDESFVVAADSASRPVFNREVAELDKIEIEVRGTLKLADLKCRDENGELIEIEPRGSAYTDLGDLLIIEEETR